jgi:UDP-N-acetyl-D-mannosaminuronate dehydrogenase
MEKVKDFFKKYKATIVSVLSAILTLAVALSEIDMGTKVGIATSILLVVIPFLLALVEGKDMETTINLLVRAIVVIQDVLKEKKTVVYENGVYKDGVTKASRKLTEEEIRELITKGL